MIDIVTPKDSMLVYHILLVNCLILIPIRIHVDHIVTMFTTRAMENVDQYLPAMNLLLLTLKQPNHLTSIDKIALPVLIHLEFRHRDTIAVIFLIPDRRTISTMPIPHESPIPRLISGHLDHEGFEPPKAPLPHLHLLLDQILLLIVMVLTTIRPITQIYNISNHMFLMTVQMLIASCIKTQSLL